MSLLDHMCKNCDYYMPLGPTENGDLMRVCRNCGDVQDEKKGIVMEMTFQNKGTDSFKLFVNEFTKQDPRIPHVTNLKCPNEVCPSREPNAKSDVLYIKYDTANMKFLYICSICDTQWRSRS